LTEFVESTILAGGECSHDCSEFLEVTIVICVILSRGLKTRVWRRVTGVTRGRSLLSSLTWDLTWDAVLLKLSHISD
jgi:hypothetical protein